MALEGVKEPLESSETPENVPLKFTLKNVDCAHEHCNILGVRGETLEHFGIGFYSGRGMFKEHLVLPIHNLDAELIGYAGRSIIEGELGDWLYLPKFSASVVLYNGHRVAEMLKKARETPILVGDILEAVRLFDRGFPAAVAYLDELPSSYQINLYRTIQDSYLK